MADSVQQDSGLWLNRKSCGWNCMLVPALKSVFLNGSGACALRSSSRRCIWAPLVRLAWSRWEFGQTHLQLLPLELQWLMRRRDCLRTCSQTYLYLDLPPHGLCARLLLQTNVLLVSSARSHSRMPESILICLARSAVLAPTSSSRRSRGLMPFSPESVLISS